MRVNVFHNVSTDEHGRHLGMMDGYEPAHRLTQVATLELPDDFDDIAACEEAFRLFNVGDDPEFGTPDPRAVEYRRGGHRSLSVGDVVQVDTRWYACASVGWDRIDPDEARIVEVGICRHCREDIYADDNGAGRAIWVHDFGSTVCYDSPPGSVEAGDTTTTAEPGA